MVLACSTVQVLSQLSQQVLANVFDRQNLSDKRPHLVVTFLSNIGGEIYTSRLADPIARISLSEDTLLEVKNSVLDSDKVDVRVEGANELAGLVEKKGEDRVRNQRCEGGILQTQNDIPENLAWTCL